MQFPSVATLLSSAAGLLLLAPQFTQALPNGAPKCGINATAITMGMNSASDATLQYQLSVAPMGNNQWAIQVTNAGNTRLDYQGLLLYVHQLNTPKVHLGSLSFKNQTKWKYQPLTLCNAGGVTSSTANSTITHANPDRVLLSKGVTFVWTASTQELGLPSLVVHGAVASLDPGKTGVARWQILNFVGIPPSGPMAGTTPTATGSVSGAVSSQAPTVSALSATLSSTVSGAAATATATPVTTGAATTAKVNGALSSSSIQGVLAVILAASSLMF